MASLIIIIIIIIRTPVESPIDKNILKVLASKMGKCNATIALVWADTLQEKIIPQ